MKMGILPAGAVNEEIKIWRLVSLLSDPEALAASLQEFVEARVAASEAKEALREENDRQAEVLAALEEANQVAAKDLADRAKKLAAGEEALAQGRQDLANQTAAKQAEFDDIRARLTVREESLKKRENDLIARENELNDRELAQIQDLKLKYEEQENIITARLQDAEKKLQAAAVAETEANALKEKFLAKLEAASKLQALGVD